MAVSSIKNKYGIVPFFRAGRRWALGALAALPLILAADPAAAQISTALNGILNNLVNTIQDTPALITAFSYLLGLIIGISAIFKLKEHVENPANVPLRIALIRFLIGGALFALPTVYSAMYNLITGGADSVFDPSGTVGSAINETLAWVGTFGGFDFVPNINGILAAIMHGIDESPAVVTAFAYLLGLIFGVAGLLKLKEHVENPDQVKIKEIVVRFIAGGAFFALPTIYQAMHDLVVDAGLLGDILDGLGALGFLLSEWDVGAFGFAGCITSAGVGSVFCNLMLHTAAFPSFLTGLSYIIGVILGFWAILKIKDHVENPQQTSLWEGVSRFVAGGFFLALPLMVQVLRQTVTPVTLSGSRVAQAAFTGYNETRSSCNGLDGALYCMMSDILSPLHMALNFFTFVAGMMFLMIGISRLTKTAQDGARGPGGIGTFMTFVIGGLLISYNEIIRGFTYSLGLGWGFGPVSLPLTATYARLSYTVGMTTAELQHAHTVISAIIKFVLIIGLISFVRGLFIVRDVAEGNGQASLMAGMTHIVGGALAVNLGPLMNAVQTTLGITGYGIAFS